jgi:acyl-CoA synthetase (AMP-forming)/AMP-acid ligase II
LKEKIILDENEVIQFCRTKLPNYMVPAKVVIYDELPLNPTGKIDSNMIKSNYPG